MPSSTGPPDVLEEEALEEEELDDDDAPDVELADVDEELAELEEELESDEPELEDEVESTVLSSKQPAAIVIIARLGTKGVILKRETMGPLAVGRCFRQ